MFIEVKIPKNDHNLAQFSLRNPSCPRADYIITSSVHAVFNTLVVQISQPVFQLFCGPQIVVGPCCVSNFFLKFPCNFVFILFCLLRTFILVYLISKSDSDTCQWLLPPSTHYKGPMIQCKPIFSIKFFIYAVRLSLRLGFGADVTEQLWDTAR